MRYLYVSENAFEVMGQTKLDYLYKGVEFGFSNIIEEDQTGLLKFSSLINQYYKRLSKEEKSKYQSYWDYRVWKSTGEQVRILQRDNVLDYNEKGQITKVLFVCVDITDHKKQENLHLRLTNGRENLVYEYSIADKKLLTLEQLTKRELEVARLISKGKSRTDIATDLDISFHTVVSHCKKILTKLNVNDSVEMINLLRILGFL